MNSLNLPNWCFALRHKTDLLEIFPQLEGINNFSSIMNLQKVLKYPEFFFSM
jgi:hypothetical protein